MLYIIILLGLFLRLINLGQSFWLDEAAQLVMSQQSLNWVWFSRSGDFHPPLFYFLTHYWLQISQTEFFLRILPVAFGILSIPSIYLLVAKLFSKKIALYGALFTAINPYLVYYSQEMRSYSLMLFLSILSMNYLVRRQWLWLVLTNALLLYAHYSSVLFIFSQLVFVLFYDKKYLSRYIICCLQFTILFLPWLPQLLIQFHSGISIDQYLPGWRAELTLPLFKSVPLIFFKFIAGRIDLIPNYIYLVYVSLVIASCLFFLYLVKKSYPLLTIWLILPIFTSMVLSLFIPQTQPFRLIFCLPALIIYFSIAASKHPKKVLTVIMYIFIVGNFMQITRPRLQREQWREAVSYLNSQNLPIIVKFVDSFAPMKWYGLKSAVITAYPNLPESLPKSFLLTEYLTGITDPNHNIEKIILANGYLEISAQDFTGVGIIRKYVFSH